MKAFHIVQYSILNILFNYINKKKIYCIEELLILRVDIIHTARMTIY